MSRHLQGMPGRFSISPAAWVLTGAAAAVLAAAAPAAAQPGPVTLGEALDGRRAGATAFPTVARYTAGEQAFVLEQRGGQAMLRFEGSDEIWVLRPQTGPRGDLIWRNDAGRTVIMASRLGGMTVFTPTAPGGAPAEFASAAQGFQLPTISPQALLRLLVEASVRASQAVRHAVYFEGPLDIRPGEEPVLADAALIASRGIARAAGSRRPPPATQRLRWVRLSRGANVGAAMANDTMTVTVNPARGAAGRPSSDKIYQALATAR